MSSTKSSTNASGVSGLFLLFLLFLGLKLGHVIDWSWLWITAPLWIPFGIGLVVVLFVFIGVVARK